MYVGETVLVDESGGVLLPKQLSLFGSSLSPDHDSHRGGACAHVCVHGSHNEVAGSRAYSNTICRCEETSSPCRQYITDIADHIYSSPTCKCCIYTHTTIFLSILSVPVRT